MVGIRLQRARKSKRMTQKQLADKLELSVHSISSYERERNSPNDETMVRVAQIFNISLDYLFGLVDEKCSYKRDELISLPYGLTDEALEKIQDYVDTIALANNMVVKINKNKKKIKA